MASTAQKLSGRPQDVKVALVHLGCARNLIDSETILGRLGREGYVLCGAVEDADVAVLNTCSFIGPAREESENALAELARVRTQGGLRGLLVVGCLPEKFLEQTATRFPQVDAFLGLSDYSAIARILEDVLRGRKIDPKRPGGARQQGQGEEIRLLQTPRSYAYLRPSHGCDHSCAFCIIPAIRGPQRSKTVAATAEEARQLVASGVRELILVAEDSTGYGTDFGPGGDRLPELIDALAQVEGLSWLRLMYAYPHAFPWRLTEIIRRHETVLPYLDIPVQHISSKVLKRMRRGGSRESVTKILTRLREEIPGLTLRTTVLVGHPGESPAEFQELLEFIEEFRFERLGAFAFSPEAGTPAGDDPDRAGPEETLERLDQVMELQARVHHEHNEGWVGKETLVLIDSRDQDLAVGHTPADAPEADSLTFVQDDGQQLQPGDLIRARITATQDYDFIATPLG